MHKELLGPVHVDRTLEKLIEGPGVPQGIDNDTPSLKWRIHNLNIYERKM